ncbi:MAG: hypothetical protein WBW81_12145, partial [Methylocella sp.]
MTILRFYAIVASVGITFAFAVISILALAPVVLQHKDIVHDYWQTVWKVCLMGFRWRRHPIRIRHDAHSWARSFATFAFAGGDR